MTDRTPVLYDVPAATAAAKCRAGECAATIYFIPSPKTGNPIPIDCNGEEGLAPTPTESGRGVLHHMRCKRPDAFRRPKPPPAPDPMRDQKELPVAHRAPSCIFCGCTTEKRCLILTPEVDAEHPDPDGPLPYAECTMLQLDPPVCSAEACAKQRESLPLRKRLPSHPTPSEASP